MKLFVYIAILLVSLGLTAQNTLSFNEGTTSPEASLQTVAWMAGHWKGEAFGGITEEIWSPPSGGSMMFVFRLISDDTVNFYEIGHIKQVDETLVFELKHFGSDLKGWEEKDDVQSFKLIKVEDNRLYFDGFTFEKIDATEINIYGLVHGKDGKAEEVTFNYKKQ